MTSTQLVLTSDPTPTVLVVDDDPVFRSLTRDTLADTGLSVIEAADGMEALRRCREQGPALLLVDAVMPNLDGFALCRELRNQDATRHTPILMITGLRDDEAFAKAYQAGATDILVKPIKWDSLAERVRDALGAVPDGPTAVNAKQVDADQPGNAARPISILIVDDDPVVRSLTRDALEDEGYEVVEAEDGLVAYDACLQSVPGMIIADVVMPGISGFDLCRLLRERPETTQVPILVSTGLNDDQSIVDAYDAGATDFILKPVNWRILCYRVRYMLRAARVFTDLVSAKQRAEAADRAKSAFLANMTHELRTPLNAVIGFSEIMHREVLGPISAQYAEYAKLIGESGSHLLTIINDLLDLAKDETQGLQIGEDLVHIPEIVSFSLRMVQAMAQDAGIACQAHVEPGLPMFRGDAKKLQQILINLLVNAVKFTPAGGRVTLRADRDAAGSGLLLQVADTGIGIPPDKIDIALAPFGQIPSELGRKHNGVGLGLPLSKRLVELHGGTLYIDSTPGVGTTITLRFPPDRFVPTLPPAYAVN